ncbi:MAG: biotin/lipoyl-binding protein, partial [Chloroflexota bacterium]|nr:biotin/lipoyl-binding protein [Chloroflexota bacterium]
MRRFRNALGPLTIPQLLLALVVFGGAVAGAYYGVAALREPGGGAAQADEQLVTASVGDLVKRVTISGATAFPEREWQAFEGEGVVGEVLVGEGDRVSAGDVIARLDGASILKRERALAVARSDLRDAEEALAAALETEEALADANVERNAALEDLDIALADRAVKQTHWANALADAEEALADAEEASVAVYRAWLGITLTDGQLDSAPDDLLAAWGVDLGALFLPAPGVHVDSFSLPSDDPATPWNEQTVASWTHLYPDVVVGACEDAPPSSYDRCVKGEMDTAWDAYRGAGAAQAPEHAKAPSPQLAPPHPRLKTPHHHHAAEEALAEAEAGPDALEVSIAQADVALALLDVQDSAELLEGAVLVASISGVVNEVAVESGDALGATGRVLEIVDPSIVEVEGTVDEID